MLKHCEGIIKFLEAFNIEPKSAIELGVRNGDLTQCLMKKLSIEDYWGVDSYEEHDKNIWSNTDTIKQNDQNKIKERAQKRYDELGANLIIARTDEAYEQFEDRSIDLVFIDANHVYEAVFNDIINWGPKVKIGGLISGHDALRNRVANSVTDAIHRAFNTSDLAIHEESSSWAIKKTVDHDKKFEDLKKEGFNTELNTYGEIGVKQIKERIEELPGYKENTITSLANGKYKVTTAGEIVRFIRYKGLEPRQNSNFNSSLCSPLLPPDLAGGVAFGVDWKGRPAVVDWIYSDFFNNIIFYDYLRDMRQQGEYLRTVRLIII